MIRAAVLLLLLSLAGCQSVAKGQLAEPLVRVPQGVPRGGVAVGPQTGCHCRAEIEAIRREMHQRFGEVEQNLGVTSNEIMAVREGALAGDQELRDDVAATLTDQHQSLLSRIRQHVREEAAGAVGGLKEKLLSDARSNAPALIGSAAARWIGGPIGAGLAIGLPVLGWFVRRRRGDEGGGSGGPPSATFRR